MKNTDDPLHDGACSDLLGTQNENEYTIELLYQ
jgi:hypothetical protein